MAGAVCEGAARAEIVPSELLFEELIAVNNSDAPLHLRIGREASVAFAAGQFAIAFVTVCIPPDSRSGKEAQPISNSAGLLVTIG